MCLFSNHSTNEYLTVCQVQFYFILFFLFIYFFNFWLCWVFIAACGLSLVAASGGATVRCSERTSHCRGFSCCRALALGVQAQYLWLAGFRTQA